MPLIVACAQIAPLKAQIETNLDSIAEAIEQAATEGADIVVLPEASTSGYFLEGGVLEASLTSEELLEKLKARLNNLKKPIDAVVGFYEREEGQLYNAAAYLELGSKQDKVVYVYRKFFLPTYGVFDEERFVARGRQLGAFDTRFGRLGILICEDIWHSVLPTLLAVEGCQLILIPSASPGRGFSGDSIDNLDRYKRLIVSVSEEHGLFTVNCQLCGFEGGKGFVGGSMIADPFGKLIAQSPIAEPHLMITTLDLELIPIARAQSPLIGDLQGVWEEVKRLVAESSA